MIFLIILLPLLSKPKSSIIVITESEEESRFPRNNNSKALKVVIARVTIGMSSNCLIKCPRLAASLIASDN